MFCVVEFKISYGRLVGTVVERVVTQREATDLAEKYQDIDLREDVLYVTVPNGQKVFGQTWK